MWVNYPLTVYGIVVDSSGIGYSYNGNLFTLHNFINNLFGCYYMEWLTCKYQFFIHDLFSRQSFIYALTYDVSNLMVNCLVRYSFFHHSQLSMELYEWVTISAPPRSNMRFVFSSYSWEVDTYNASPTWLGFEPIFSRLWTQYSFALPLRSTAALYRCALPLRSTTALSRYPNIHPKTTLQSMSVHVNQR